MIRKLSGRTPDGKDVVGTYVLEYRAVLTGKTSDVGRVTTQFEHMMESVLVTCDVLNVATPEAGGLVRSATYEEIKHLVPRKWHMRSDDRHLCATAHVSKKRLTDDPKKVTCRLCLKEMQSTSSSTG